MTAAANDQAGPDGPDPLAGIEDRLLDHLGTVRPPAGEPDALRTRLRYHLDEYRLQQASRGRGGLLARPGLVRGRVLDVGCGLGQLLLTAGQAGTAEILAGVDLDRDILRCGRRLALGMPGLAPPPALAAGDALRLPFADGVFDLVVCRVVLMSLPVVPALRELTRVMRPGGHLYLHLTGWGFYVDDARHGRIAGSLFALLNGALLHITGRQLRVRGLWNNFTTSGRVVRILRAHGLAIEAVLEGPRRYGGPLNSKVLARRPPAEFP